MKSACRRSVRFEGRGQTESRLISSRTIYELSRATHSFIFCSYIAKQSLLSIHEIGVLSRPLIQLLDKSDGEMAVGKIL